MKQKERTDIPAQRAGMFFSEQIEKEYRFDYNKRKANCLNNHEKGA